VGRPERAARAGGRLSDRRLEATQTKRPAADLSVEV